MKFLFVANTERNPNQGAAGCDLSTMEALRALGHDVDEVWGPDMPRRIAHPNLHQLLELPRNFADAVDARSARGVYDVIQVNQPHAYLAARRHRQRGRPGVFINRSHGWEPALREAVERYGDFRNGRRPLWRRAASRVMACFVEQHNQHVVESSDGVVLCSIDDRDYLIERHKADPERLLALAPGIASDFLDPLPEEAPDRWKRILYIGNFCAPKAPEVVAEVLRRVIDSNPECQATWVCPAEFHGPARKLVGPEAVQKVNFLDWMPKREVVSLLDRHGFLLFPSYFEGFPLTFLQAMARGLCVMATNVSAMRQVIADGCNGFVFPRAAAEPMARTAAGLLADPQRCRVVSAEARRTSLQFTWERTARKYVEFCERLAELKARSAARVS